MEKDDEAWNMKIGAENLTLLFAIGHANIFPATPQGMRKILIAFFVIVHYTRLATSAVEIRSIWKTELKIAAIAHYRMKEIIMD